MDFWLRLFFTLFFLYMHLHDQKIFTLVGKNLFVPKVDPSLAGGMDVLKIQDEEDLRSIPSGIWGIKEPTFQYREAPRMKGSVFASGGNF